MFALHEDSIIIQSKALREAETKLKNLSKDAQKNDKNRKQEHSKSKRQYNR